MCVLCLHGCCVVVMNGTRFPPFFLGCVVLLLRVCAPAAAVCCWSSADLYLCHPFAHTGSTQHALLGGAAAESSRPSHLRLDSYFACDCESDPSSIQSSSWLKKTRLIVPLNICNCLCMHLRTAAVVAGWCVLSTAQRRLTPVHPFADSFLRARACGGWGIVHIPYHCVCVWRPYARRTTTTHCHTGPCLVSGPLLAGVVSLCHCTTHASHTQSPGCMATTAE